MNRPRVALLWCPLMAALFACMFVTFSPAAGSIRVSSAMTSLDALQNDFEVSVSLSALWSAPGPQIPSACHHGMHREPKRGRFFAQEDCFCLASPECMPSATMGRWGAAGALCSLVALILLPRLYLSCCSPAEICSEII